MLCLQDGGGKQLELHMFLAFTHLHLQIFTFLQGVREAELVGRLPEEGSAGQSCLEATCRLLDHIREHVEGACRLLDHTLRWTVALFAESFREFSSRDLFHMYLPVNYRRRRTNKSMNLVVIILLIGLQGLLPSCCSQPGTTPPQQVSYSTLRHMYMYFEPSCTDFLSN